MALQYNGSISYVAVQCKLWPRHDATLRCELMYTVKHCIIGLCIHVNSDVNKKPNK